MSADFEVRDAEYEAMGVLLRFAAKGIGWYKMMHDPWVAANALIAAKSRVYLGAVERAEVEDAALRVAHYHRRRSARAIEILTGAE